MAHLIYCDEKNGVTVYAADKGDAYGNARHIVHFLNFLTEEEKNANEVHELYELARRKIRKHGGHWRRYHCREFGGGFITQGDWAGGRETAARVLEIRNAAK